MNNLGNGRPQTSFDASTYASISDGGAKWTGAAVKARHLPLVRATGRRSEKDRNDEQEQARDHKRGPNAASWDR